MAYQKGREALAKKHKADFDLIAWFLMATNTVPIEDGIHTYDTYKKGISKQRVGTKEAATHAVRSQPSQGE